MQTRSAAELDPIVASHSRELDEMKKQLSILWENQQRFKEAMEKSDTAMGVLLHHITDLTAEITNGRDNPANPTGA